MLRLIVLALVGFGIYLGITYKDKIDDARNVRPFEKVQDAVEDARDNVKDKLEVLKGHNN
ncbi:YtxH domain-containing protein [Photobacterium damselae]|uniref:YtxH domain-containing protein n=1 Tax=Photobacterium damselae TaxID=38293 RepID=UPI0013029D99|nr:YtxH domain-containing protein [Photobacterium damselae]